MLGCIGLCFLLVLSIGVCCRGLTVELPIAAPTASSSPNVDNVSLQFSPYSEDVSSLYLRMLNIDLLDDLIVVV